MKIRKNLIQQSAHSTHTEPDSGHRIGLYIRVSSEEQAENPEGSIRNQEERLRETVRFKNLSGYFGSIVDIFTDRAKSGKNTQRPELQRMLRAIERREISLVMVSELSRLSRSIKDFSEIWELMQACGCGFLSLRESFDTTTAAGEMVLYSVANIAQFERRQISERVIANMQARAHRGLYNGGAIPAGFRIDPERRGYLQEDPEHAQVVRQAFHTFLRQRSLAQTAKWLNSHGLKIQNHRGAEAGKTVRLSHFTTSNLHSLLRSKAAIGIKRYRHKGEVREVKAAWNAIVEPAIFHRAQEILDQNRNRYKPDSFKQHGYELTGLVFCGQCGGTLCGKSAHGNGGKIPYYEHAWLTKRNGCLLKQAYDCKPFRVPARALEPLAWEEIEKLLNDSGQARRLIENAQKLVAEQSHKVEIDRAQARVQDVQRQLDTLTERLSQLPPEIDPKPVYRQMERLQAILRDEENRVYALKQNSAYDLIPAELPRFEILLQDLRNLAKKSDDHSTRARIAQTLVHRIEIIPNGFRVHFKWTEGDIEKGLVQASVWIQEFSGAKNESRFGTNRVGSRTLTNGWPSWTKLGTLSPHQAPSGRSYLRLRVTSKPAVRSPMSEPTFDGSLPCSWSPT